MTAAQLTITHQQPNRVVLAIEHRSIVWEVDVHVDIEADGGITTDITRDGVLCTSAEFGWNDTHENG